MLDFDPFPSQRTVWGYSAPPLYFLTPLGWHGLRIGEGRGLVIAEPV